MKAKILIAILFIAYLIGGMLMVKGFSDSKCAYEVYSKADFAILSGQATINSGSNTTGWVDLELPEGFTKDNSVVLSQTFGLSNQYIYGFLKNAGEEPQHMSVLFFGDFFRTKIQVNSNVSSDTTYNYKIILLKIS